MKPSWTYAALAGAMTVCVTSRSALAQEAPSRDEMAPLLSQLAEDARRDRHLIGGLALTTGVLVAAAGAGLAAGEPSHTDHTYRTTGIYVGLFTSSFFLALGGSLRLAISSDMERLSADYHARIARGESPAHARATVERRWRLLSEQYERDRVTSGWSALVGAMAMAIFPSVMLLSGVLPQNERLAAAISLVPVAFFVGETVHQIVTPFVVTRSLRLWDASRAVDRPRLSLGAMPLNGGATFTLSGTF